MDLQTTSTKSDHAFLSPSKYHWIRYDKEKLTKTFYNFLAVEHGTKMHAIAADLISEKIRVQKKTRTFNMYVNDAITFNMEPERLLRYSDNLFGTADALSFDGQLLRIHDLKTGSTPAHMDQLIIYAGLYCMINHIDPFTIRYELRIYQNDDVNILEPEPETIQDFIFKMKEADDIVKELRASWEERYEHY